MWRFLRWVAGPAARAALAIALLAAWQSSLLHPIQHHDEAGRFVHIVGGSAPDKPSEGDPSSKLCDAVTALSVCVADAAAAHPQADTSDVPFTDVGLLHGMSAGPPFYSQAPPIAS